MDSVGNTAAHNAILYCSSLKRMDEQEKMTVVTSVSECLVVLGFEGANFDLLNNGGSAAIHVSVGVVYILKICNAVFVHVCTCMSVH